MRNLFTHKYSWLAGLGICVLLIFFLFRPLNSPHYRIIVADGLGYYSYLPAKYIYNDTELKFNWFDTVFNKNYDNHLFEKPTQNFMVKYKERMINLYFPGQSLLQAPFFFLAHFSTRVLDYAPDGFSLPYQIAMGLSGIFYTLLGLFFCSKLLFNISQNKKLSILIPLLIFFGTNLFTYSIFAGCYTHCYSFCFISLSLYFSQKFFESEAKSLSCFLMAAFSALVVLFLRPVNGILLLSVFYFFKPFSFQTLFSGKKNIPAIIVSLLLISVVIAYNTGITKTQTGSLLANTYTIGAFYFDDWSHILDNFFGFQNGILWYTPLIFICFTPLLHIRKHPKLLWLLVPVFAVIVMYSLWFYWNIVTRTLVDFSTVLAILLLHVFTVYRSKEKVYRVILVLTLLCIPFCQLKAYQLRNGILNSTYTYWKYYVKHFFTLHHVDVYPINPRTVISTQDYFYDFEKEESGEISKGKSFEGQSAIILNSQLEFAGARTLDLPGFFKNKGFKKIKASFWFYRSEKLQNIHLVFAFTRNDSTFSYNPFFINKSTPPNKWEYKEFGMDLPENVDTTQQLKLYFWNPDKKNEAFIDNFKLEFVLKNGSDEITMPE